MTAQLQFRNLTLGYDRHPAVHHLDGAVAAGSLIAVVGPNGAGKSTLFKGVVGVLKPLAGRIERNGVRAAGHRLSAAGRRDRPHVPDQRLRHGGDGAVARQRPVRRHRPPRTATRSKHAIAAVGLTGFEPRPIGTLSGGQMQRMLFARLLLQDARVIVLDEPFNAIDAKTCADLLDLVRRWHARAAHRAGRAARSRNGQGEFSRDAAARARAGGLGRDRRGADAGEHAQGAAHVRGVRRAGARPASSRRRSRRCHVYDIFIAPVRRIRVHAPRAGRHACARARRRRRSACS